MGARRFGSAGVGESDWAGAEMLTERTARHWRALWPADRAKHQAEREAPRGRTRCSLAAPRSHSREHRL